MATLTSLDAVKTQLGIGTLNTDDALLTTFVAAASKMIESHCKQPLVSTIETLYLDACPPHVYGSRLRFDGRPVRGIVSLTNGNAEAITSDQYLLQPPNEAISYSLTLKRTEGVRFTHTGEPRQAITLVGTIGLFDQDSVPADLELAATKLAAWLYMNRDNDENIIQLADGTKSIPAEAPALVTRILEGGSYIRAEIYP